MSLILKGFESDALVEQINNSPSKRLIHEIHFKYGLKVLNEDKGEFLMCEPSTGFAVAKVWTATEDNETVYNYRSPYYVKERGRSTADRETIHSKKLSTLMGTIKRQEVIPTIGYLVQHHSECWGRGRNIMEQSFGKTEKQFNHLGAEQIHALLQKALGVSPNTKTYQLDTNICQELLDKYNKLDKIKEEKEQEVNRFFGNEFWCVGADNNGHLLVGSVKQIPTVSTQRLRDAYQIVKPFKRVCNLDEYENLKPIMLMMKVHMQDKTDKFIANTIPQTSVFLSDLDMIITYSFFLDSYNFVWALTP
jgi:superoxide dismutase